MVTRKQHYYPRFLLKNFANDNNKLYAYIPHNNIITKQNYEKVCFEIDSYESSQIPDNKLEKILGKYENEVSPIIKKILNNIFLKDFNKEELLSYKGFREYYYSKDGTFINDYHPLFNFNKFFNLILIKYLSYSKLDRVFILNSISEKLFYTKLGEYLNYDFELTNVEKLKIYRFIFLQFIRTNSGRIIFMDLIESGSNYKKKLRPINLDDISNKKDKIMRFNKKFKKDGELEKVLNKLIIPEHITFKIGISIIDLITSDHPVVQINNIDQIYLPLSSSVSLQFHNKFFYTSENIFAITLPPKAYIYNNYTINTSNYYVISKTPFIKSHKFKMMNRFNKNLIPKIAY